MAKNKVSPAVIRRLPRYYRYLTELMKTNITKISSSELGERMKVTPSQIRQDFNCFGGFGQQGYGYNVESLRSEIANILGLDQLKDAILVGAGNLGRALANHIAFEKRGFRLTGIFDTNSNMIGRTINGIEVMSADKMDAFIAQHPPVIAILTVPRAEAQKVVSHLIALGVKGFWNFSNADIHVDGVFFENVHLGDSLMTLSYSIANEDADTVSD